MGADGGLNWIRVKDQKYYDRAIALISPLGLIETSLRSEDYDWLYKNYIPKNTTIMSRYGTDLDHSGMYHLMQILDYEDENNLTFQELVEDLATRPDWLMYGLSVLDKAVFKVCDLNSWLDYEFRFKTEKQRGYQRLDLKSDCLGILQSMLISTWVSELEKMIIPNSYSSVETWT
jgi:hypothetical protein